MICNFTLRYFFMSIQPDQLQMIQKLVHGLDEASTEHVELERIFNEFFQGTRGLQT